MLRMSTNILRIRMDTTTDTIGIADRSQSYARSLGRLLVTLNVGAAPPSFYVMASREALCQRSRRHNCELLPPSAVEFLVVPLETLDQLVPS
jgi:hypothetical protein